MRRKTPEELMQEAQQLVAKAKEQQAKEAKEEEQRAGRRHRLMGIKLERMMRSDPNLRSRMEGEMNGFCTRRYDREVFGFGTPDNYFKRLARPPEERERSAAPSEAAADGGPSDTQGEQGGQNGKAASPPMGAARSGSSSARGGPSAPRTSNDATAGSASAPTTRAEKGRPGAAKVGNGEPEDEESELDLDIESALDSAIGGGAAAPASLSTAPTRTPGLPPSRALSAIRDSVAIGPTSGAAK